MNILVSSIQTLDRKNSARLFCKILLAAYVASTFASAFLMFPASSANWVDLLVLPIDYIFFLFAGFVTTFGTACLILRVLWDLQQGKLLCTSNARRLRSLSVLACFDILIGAYIALRGEHWVPSMMWWEPMSTWQAELIDYGMRAQRPFYMLFMALTWFGLSLLLSEAIQIDDKQRELI